MTDKELLEIEDAHRTSYVQWHSVSSLIAEIRRLKALKEPRCAEGHLLGDEDVHGCRLCSVCSRCTGESIDERVERVAKRVLFEAVKAAREVRKATIERCANIASLEGCGEWSCGDDIANKIRELGA